MLYFSLTFFDCSQGLERGFLGLCQSLDVGNVHAFIWSFADECFEALSRLYVPEFDHSVVATTGKQTSIRAKGHPSYPASMALQSFKALTSFGVPEANALIFTTTDKQSPIRTKSDRSD